jgi:hypothetical protein
MKSKFLLKDKAAIELKNEMLKELERYEWGRQIEPKPYLTSKSAYRLDSVTISR